MDGLHQDLEALRRKINLTILFAGEPPRRNPSSLVSKVVPSGWLPPPTIQEDAEPWRTFRNATAAALSGTEPSRNNFPRRLVKAWRSLSCNPAFYTIPADKGGKIVLWSRENYEREALRQLRDTSCYKPLSGDEAAAALATTIRDRNSLVTDLRIGGYITGPEATRLRTWEGSIPAVYFLPKVHKEKRTDTGTFPGRPIMAGTNGPLVQVDKFLTAITAPLLPRIPRSLQDTRHLLRELDDQRVPAGARLFSADVEALYPSIPWEEGIDAATRFYEEHYGEVRSIARQANTCPPPPPPIFSDLLRLIITRNVFHLQDRLFYHQISGTAMGCCMSVFFANTFMYARSRSIIENPPRGLLYLGRYIDDLVGIFNGTPEEAEDAVAPITDKDIRLTFVHTSEEKPGLEALDVRLTIEGDRIRSTLYRKPTDGHQFLHWNSAHPLHLKRSIPYAQLLRYRVNCSRDEDFVREAATLCKRFIKRGYPRRVLAQAYEKARASDRRALLHGEPARPAPSRDEEPAFTFVVQAEDVALPGIRAAMGTLAVNLVDIPAVRSKQERIRQPVFESGPPRLAIRCGRRLGSSLGPVYKRGGRPTRTAEGLQGTWVAPRAQSGAPNLTKPNQTNPIRALDGLRETLVGPLGMERVNTLTKPNQTYPIRALDGLQEALDGLQEDNGPTALSLLVAIIDTSQSD